MADDITNKMLLEHMQAMKHELQEQIKSVKADLQNQITSLSKSVEDGFEDARLHREAIQVDLDETIRVQGGLKEKLAGISR